MSELHALFERVLSFRAEAKKILSKHESSTDRVVIIEQTYKRLSSLSLKQDDLFRQALRCVELKVFRGAHILAWAAMADYLEEWLASDGFKTLASKRPAWGGIKTVEQLRETYPDYQIIGAVRVCDYVGKNTEKALLALLERRNQCAHPSSFYPELNMTLGYLSELLQWLEQFEIKRRSGP